MLVNQGEFQPDIGNLDAPGQQGAVAEEQTRLHCLERDSAISAKHMARSHAREGVDTARHVDGEYQRCSNIRRQPLAAKASSVGRVDNEASRGQSGWQRGSVNYFYLYATASKYCRSHAPVGTVVAFTGNHHDHSAVAAAQHVQGGPGDRPTCSIDQFVDGFRCRNVGCRHLAGSQHREHCCNLCGQ
jgi:hypothetical protein